MNDGQTDAALEQYKSIVDADPSDAQTYMRIAEIDRRNGKFDQAMDALKKASAVVPDSLEVQYNIAVVDEAQGKYDDAITILNSAAAEDRARRSRLHGCRQEQSRRCSWSGWGRSIAKPTRISSRSIPSARCWTWATRTPFAAIRRSSKPIATTSSGSWPPTSPRKQPRSFPTTAICRWWRRRSRPTWATPGRPSSG